LSSDVTSNDDETNTYLIFKDHNEDCKHISKSTFVEQCYVPSLDEVTSFYRRIYFDAEMQADCVIMSLIYVERLITETFGRLRPRANNWRSILLSCMLLSSKVSDDNSMSNRDFSTSCPLSGIFFTVQRINQLESEVLDNILKYRVSVSSSEYAKYYFLLRSMLIKSGLGGQELDAVDPLHVERAIRLHQVSFRFQSNSLAKSYTYGQIQRS